MTDNSSRTKPFKGKRRNIYYQAQAILSRRDHSQYEVRQKLGRKGFHNTQINEVIAWLCDKRLLDDETFARTYVHNILNTKAVGPRWLTAKLKQKGIAPDVIEQAVVAGFAQESEMRVARRAATQWLRRTSTSSADLQGRQRLMRFLASRGFSPHAIQAAVEPEPVE